MKIIVSFSPKKLIFIDFFIRSGFSGVQEGYENN